MKIEPMGGNVWSEAENSPESESAMLHGALAGDQAAIRRLRLLACDPAALQRMTAAIGESCWENCLQESKDDRGTPPCVQKRP
jgi:hypothetical protein